MKVMDKLEQVVDTGKVIDVEDLFYRFTLDSMGEVGFGHNISSLDKDVPFAQAFNRTQKLIDREFRDPSTARYENKSFDADIKVMDDYIYNILNQRKKTGYEDKDDLLSKYMALRDDDGKPPSDVHIRDMIMNFFIAGRDTTATLLTWTFYLLSQHPEQEQTLVDEIDHVLAGKEPQHPEDFSTTKYLHNVLDESLRLYPPVPLDGRSCKNDITLPNGLSIPAGSTVNYSSWVTHKSPLYWDNPLKFDPDRFDRPYNKDAYLAFHIGPQLCLGRAMAYLEAKILTSVLLQRFTLRLAEGHKVEPQPCIVLKARYGMKMTVHRRKQSS
eukprot:CAMPEP_0174275028 /NCGR_PEP_ID=MMETSP0439-20130205/59605_1 /TAXON_ID=0 /ORGANISM="Stereomyxa ramosa, Strain Chinc5" /LENGTH=326 /DNA_ID=CAMNT_0015367101 /DNA_START=1080 /DNA_END=2060 /DNA_ORIENTATION=+